LEACIKYNLKNNNFYKSDKPLYMKGFLFSRFELTPKEKEYFNRYRACKKYWCRKPIYQKDLKNNFIKEWSCTEEAAKYLKISSGALNQALKGKVKICKNSLWSYSDYKNPWH
jgi:hypothetical protein